MFTHIIIIRTLNVSIPSSTLQNGSLYTHVFLGPKGVSPGNKDDRKRMSWSTVPLTKFAVPEATTFSLLGNSDEVVRIVQKKGP